MRCRSCFVSNSSSSSFIIMSTSEIKRITDVEELIPDFIESFRCKNGRDENEKFEIYTRMKVAEWLFRDMTKITIDNLKTFHLKHGRVLEDFDTINDCGLEEFTWEEFYSGTSLSSEKDSFKDLTEEDREYTAKEHFHFYTLGYSDEGGCWESFMEHQIAPMISLKIYNHH